MLLFILLILAILCLYGAITCFIKGIFDYKISKNVVDMLQDKDTRKLFVYLRPYISQYIEAINKNTKSYAQSMNLYNKIIDQNRKVMSEDDNQRHSRKTK